MYALREATAAFKRAPVLTGLSSAMVGLALFVVGLFMLATYNLQVALSVIEERVEVVVYLRDDARQSEIDLLLTELSEIEEVRTVGYVSKRDAVVAVQQLAHGRNHFQRQLHALRLAHEIAQGASRRT